METQNQVKRTMSRPEVIEHIRLVLDENGHMNRTMIAERLCEHYGFFDARGGTQASSCLKALRELESRGLIALPKPLVQWGPGSPRRLSEPVAAPQGVPTQLGGLRGLHLILVGTEDQMRIWNEMMIREHPKGAGPLVGRQLRYLVGSEHGWLGAAGFGAAALQLQDRDRWIGWDSETRRCHLHRVIGLSRFLIRPDVHCHNLASHLLGTILRAVPGDFENRYGFRPWLVESFVDTTCFSGTCYRAANWVRVGRTQGRGRQDRHWEMAETIKDIYLYPLDRDFGIKMGLAPDSGLSALAIADGLGADQWGEKEFGGAPLGDKRLSQRLVECVSAKASQPGRAFCGVARGDWAAVKGYYRFIDHPDETAVSMENILVPHRERSIRRMKAQQTVLCIQDGSDLDYSNLDRCEGLGVIGSNQTGAKSMGLHLHSTLVVTPSGLPLGVLNAQCMARTSRSEEDNRRNCDIPIEEKESFSWIVGLRDCMEVAKEMPRTRLVSVMDREADFFELFEEQRRNPSVELLVRAKHNRSTTGEGKLFEAAKQTEVRANLRIHVDRQSARPKKSKQKARPNRSGRTAEASIRYKQVELQPPVYHKDKPPIVLWVVHVVEDNPPEGEEGIEWYLLTTMKIESVEHAERCLRWYCLRWRIEDWHRVLKSGCRIEEAAHETAERLKRSIAINLVIAWRIMLMTLLGRETPELPVEVLFSDLEIEVLNAYAKKKPSSRRFSLEMQCAW
jgi:Druantia protein DruA/Transposase DNA-binding